MKESAGKWCCMVSDYMHEHCSRRTMFYVKGLAIYDEVDKVDYYVLFYTLIILYLFWTKSQVKRGVLYKIAGR